MWLNMRQFTWTLGCGGGDDEFDDGGGESVFF